MGRTEIYSGIFDYYDHWTDIDPRLKEHHEHLSKHSEAFCHDLVNMAAYSHQILRWLQPENIRSPESVVSVGSMSEAFLVSLRSACDVLAAPISYVASDNRGQVPSDSLRSLLTWVTKNPTRVRREVRELLSQEMQWFWKLRTLRDSLVHDGTYANIHCNGRQFNLWIYSPRTGWVTREPLLPLLKNKLTKLLNFSNASSEIINMLIDLPPDRKGSRVASGVLIPALHQLVEVAENYAEPSP